MSAGTPARIDAVLLDIEGTTTPIAFVTDVLFPFARRHVRSFLERHADDPEVRALAARFREEDESAPETMGMGELAAYVEFLMDRDRKTTALKELQGWIWEEGYRRGELVSQVFPDVPIALASWRDRGVPVGIFSSGSVLAQQLLFRHSSAGDLTLYLSWYFDTRVGSKRDAESYRRIARAIGKPAGTIAFVSDVTGELDAAREAGMEVRLSVRPGNEPQPHADDFAAIRSLEELS